MSQTESIQKLLARNGFENFAPLLNEYGILCGKWCYQKEGEFHVIDEYLHEEKRENALPSGNVLLRLCEGAYQICTASQKDKSSLYPIKDSKFFIVYENNEYNELYYLEIYYSDDSQSFEYLDTQTYMALLFPKKVNKGIISTFVDRYQPEIKLDYIVSKRKDIIHKRVFSYFYKNFVIVYDGKTTFVYNNNFDVVYERDSNLRIWEVEDKVYLLFLNDKVIYELNNGKEIALNLQGSLWYYVWAYKKYIIFYNQYYYQKRGNTCYLCEYEEYDWGYDESVKETRWITTGYIFNSSFNLLRDFNALGEMDELKDIGDDVFMKTISPHSTSNEVYSFFNINHPNITRHDDKTNEDFSVPDISFRPFKCSPWFDEYLYIAKKRVASSDTIDLRTYTKKDLWVDKYGVFQIFDFDKEEYVKITDCKYDNIVALPLKNDENIYYAGINGDGKYGVFDLYINNEIKLKELPYIKGASSLKTVNNSNFIQFRDKIGNVGVIRYGITILEPLYKEVTIYEFSYFPDDELDFLFVVSDGKSYGICSPEGKLVFPIEFSLIDVDKNRHVILEHNDSDTIEVVYYDEESDSFEHVETKIEDGVVHINDNYVWDGSFRYLKVYDHLEGADFDSRDPRDLRDELEDAADFAYEGYSRLYLGLED